MQLDDYDQKTREYSIVTKECYAENNKRVRRGEKPEFFDVLHERIADKKPDIVALSIVYSSQAFYAYALLKELPMTTIIGGPAVNEKLMKVADHVLQNEIALLEFITQTKINTDQLVTTIPDFSVYDLKEYFTPHAVIPIRTSSTCFYKQCTFCSHFNKVPYNEFDLDIIKKTVIVSGQKYVHLIDDMIPIKRL